MVRLSSVLRNQQQKKKWQQLFLTKFILVGCVMIPCLVAGCRSKFEFLKGSEQAHLHIKGVLTIAADKTLVTTKGGRNSVLRLYAHCRLPGIQTITWDLGDGSPEKQGSVVNHEYVYANNYIIQARCENQQKQFSTASLRVTANYESSVRPPKITK